MFRAPFQQSLTGFRKTPAATMDANELYDDCDDDDDACDGDAARAERINQKIAPSTALTTRMATKSLRIR